MHVDFILNILSGSPQIFKARVGPGTLNPCSHFAASSATAAMPDNSAAAKASAKAATGSGLSSSHPDRNLVNFHKALFSMSNRLSRSPLVANNFI